MAPEASSGVPDRDGPRRPQPQWGSIHPGLAVLLDPVMLTRTTPLISKGSLCHNADHRRSQVQRLPAEADEASIAKPPRRLLTDAFGCLGGGTETARLGDNRHSTARPQRPAKLLQPCLWFGPHPEVVDRQRLVEHLAEITEIQGGSESQGDSTLLNRCPVADSRLANHDLRVVDSEHETVGCAARQLTYRESRAEADHQDVVLRLHIQQSDRPPVSPSVRWP
jgi:hypothetical protein